VVEPSSDCFAFTQNLALGALTVTSLLEIKESDNFAILAAQNLKSLVKE
jgi:hypothetical protein